MGAAVNLSPWYDPDGVTIKHMEFVSGIEELLFVDNFCRARIFSLVTQQFRYAQICSLLHWFLMGHFVVLALPSFSYQTGLRLSIPLQMVPASSRSMSQPSLPISSLCELTTGQVSAHRKASRSTYQRRCSAIALSRRCCLARTSTWSALTSLTPSFGRSRSRSLGG